ncbi:sensor histidine kinase [Aureimonas psammosilenae]|uniref:sensor histidine kinase n=1 Tax=Aureimonas psammosilenae TaxID=2495496 RepID=UPI0012607C5E|nr:ATP-binding protein [Aureimonas psammosilenae]
MRRPIRLRLPLLLVILAAVGAVLSASAGFYAYSRALEQSLATGAGTLRLAVAALDGHLARYESLPVLIAEQPAVRELLAAPENEAARLKADAYLKSVNALLSASDVYVMLADGETVAASNFDGPASFVGENFRYRPYFQDAAEGRRGRFFGLGTTSGKRGYYFSAPVWGNGAVTGVVVFKVDLDALETSWASGEFEILVTDPEGVVFMAGRPDWRYHAFERVGPDERSRTQEIRRYAERPLPDLGVAHGRSGDRTLARIESDGKLRSFVALAEPMPAAGWTVRVLVDTAPARLQGIAVGSAALFLLGIGGFGFAAFHQRRHRLAERQRAQNEAHEELERRVGERTAALAIANGRLEREVADRRAAEELLRRTQSDLVEAGKLAALGQMSAALSHEFNQPLAAASAYADSAAVLIDRGRLSEARENVGRIASLMDRLSSISRHLRTFARRPEERLEAVHLATVVADALAIAEWRLKAADAVVETRLDAEVEFVSAVPVRLQQILVNLVSNAADAVEGLGDRRILVSAAPIAGGRVRIAVSDGGPGVPDAILPRIFDPFFTTKGVGKGLGLGLSISYNIARDFGGSLSCEKRPGGGAEFVLVLEAVEAQTKEAAQ